MAAVCGGRVAAAAASRLCARSAGGTQGRHLHVCVVGAGPAGFFVAGALLRQHTGCTVDIVDRSPVPFGLVRYGVAPDHPEVKNCENQFAALFKQHAGRLRFYGNVTVGGDVSTEQLVAGYDALVLAYGCGGDRRLDVPGAGGRNVFSARQFVSWYNGVPSAQHLPVDLTASESCAIVGHGNVALDCARVLLSPVERLAKTDVPEHVLHSLRASAIERVHLIGRRGPFQVAFTVKELREFVKMDGVDARVDCADDAFADAAALMKRVPRKRKRLMKLLMETAQRGGTPSGGGRELAVHFLQSPTGIVLDDGAVTGIEVATNRLDHAGDDDLLAAKAVPAGGKSLHECGLVLYSLGYEALPLPGVPFDATRNVVDTTDSVHVRGMPSVYACGWCARGAAGVIASTQMESRTCVAALLADVNARRLRIAAHRDRPALLDTFGKAVGWQQWLKVDRFEVQCGSKLGKPREKLLDCDRILDIAHG